MAAVSEDIGLLKIKGVGQVTLSDYKSFALAQDMLDYTKIKLNVNYYCDGCGKKNLTNYYIMELHTNSSFKNNSHMMIPDKIRVYCLTCGPNHQLSELKTKK